MSQTFKPHDYQYGIIDEILDKPRVGIWAGMGTGKTVSTLTALVDLSLVETVFPILILAPLRVAKTTWPDEIAKWEHTKHLKVSVIAGTVREREAALRVKADVYTMNYENLQWLVDALIDKWPFRVVVADELTRLKGYRTRQGSSRARALAKIAWIDVDRFIGLTGTPSPNGLSDLWGQTWFLDRGERLGRSFSAFSARWFTKGFDGYSVKPMPHAQREIEERLTDIYLTVAGLPVDEPIHNPILIDLPPKARALYDEVETHMFAEFAEKGIEAVNAAAKSSKLSQIASGAVITEDGSWEEIHDAKLDALDSVLEESAKAPVLVAYHFKSDLARLQKRFPHARVLDSNPETIHQWNRGEIQLLLAHPKSAGHGLNLAMGGNILVFFSMDWALEDHMQIIERIGPMRQKQAGLDRPVFIHYLLAKKTVDLLMKERLVTKRSVQDILLEAMDRRLATA